MDKYPLTKKEKKALKKENQKIERKSAEKQKKFQKTFRVAIGIVVFALLALFGYEILSRSAPLPQTALLEINNNDHVSGEKESGTVLIEYLDFECESCRAYSLLVKQLENEFKESLTVVTRYFPLAGHKNGLSAALAVEAAARQGKFLEMRDILFENQKKWGEKEKPDNNLFIPYAEQLGLNVEQFKKDMNDKEVIARVDHDRQSGLKLGVQGTPSFFLNGLKIQNPRSYEDFKTLIQAEIIKSSATQKIGEKIHEHADLKVYLNGTLLDLSQDKYQSTTEKPLAEDIHLHDGNGNNIHKHRTKITMGAFFKSIGIEFDKDCFILDTGERFCFEGEKTLKFFVNGKENEEFAGYEFADLDRLLITYGENSPEVLQQQLDSVTDQACLYSEKCPERGKPPTEGCAVGLGGDC